MVRETGFLTPLLLFFLCFPKKQQLNSCSLVCVWNKTVTSVSPKSSYHNRWSITLDTKTQNGHIFSLTVYIVNINCIYQIDHPKHFQYFACCPLTFLTVSKADSFTCVPRSTNGAKSLLPINTWLHIKADCEVLSKLYPPSNTKMILPSAIGVNWFVM